MMLPGPCQVLQHRVLTLIMVLCPYLHVVGNFLFISTEQHVSGLSRFIDQIAKFGKTDGIIPMATTGLVAEPQDSF